MEINGFAVDYYDFFIKKSITLASDAYVFLLPYKNIVFLKTGKRVISINVESIFFAENEFKKFLSEALSGKIIVISDYKTACAYLTKESANLAVSVENLMWIKNDPLNIYEYINGELKKENIIEAIDFLQDKFYELKNLNKDEEVCYKNLETKDIATNILSNSILYSKVNIEGLFKKTGKLFYRKIEYSNKRAITGRIICSDNFNIQNMPNEDERRKLITSRFENGFFIDFDYISFETRLSMYLTKDKDFINRFSDKDFHVEIAKIIYDKNIIEEEERKFAKNITHAVIYGAGKDTVINIIKDFENKEEIYSNIVHFLSPILSKSKQLKSELEKNGFIKNYFGTIIYPQKSYAVYNNYIQSSAADIIARKIISVNSILSGYKSKIITAVHDNIIVDFHPSEEFLIDDILEEMETISDLRFNLTSKKMLNLYN